MLLKSSLILGLFFFLCLISAAPFDLNADNDEQAILLASNSPALESNTPVPAGRASMQEIKDENIDFERVIGLIRAMNASELLRHTGSRLEIVLGERESVCTNRAGYAMMRNFFEKHPIAHFKVLHRGGGTSAYLMGIYRDRSGQSFKVRVFFGMNNGRREITRLIFR